MDGEGLKVAFCVLLWKSNGGGFLPSGEPDFVGDLVRGNCSRAYDCRTCSIMQAELAHVPPDEKGWFCEGCVDEFIQRAREAGVDFIKPGYYTEGPCDNPNCWYLRQEGSGRFSILNHLFIGPWKGGA